MTEAADEEAEATLAVWRQTVQAFDPEATDVAILGIIGFYQNFGMARPGQLEGLLAS